MSKGKFISIDMHYPSVFLCIESEDYHLLPCKIMKEKGYEAEIVTLLREGTKKEETIRGIKIKRFKNTYQLLRYASSKEIVLIHALLRPFIPSLLSSLINKPKIMTPNTYEPGSNKLIEKISVFLMNKFDLLFNLTPYEIDVYKKAGIKEEKLTWQPFAVDYDLYSSKIKDKEKLRNKWNIKKDEFVIVTTCNIKAVKNVDIMLRALAKLKDKVSNIKFMLIGPSSMESKRYQDKFQKKNQFDLHGLIKELGIEKEAVLPGTLNGNEIHEILNISHVYVSSSSVESQCISAYECAAASLALCLSNIGSFQSVFKNKALFHDSRDFEKLAENILYYYNNSEKRKKMGKELTEYVKDWDYKIIKKKMTEHFYNVLKKHNQKL